MNPAIAATPSLVAPIDSSQVQESRTKRLVRQQARFRDRGGIFVPRAHNNLLDILLGRKKASPLKRRSRSRSLSVSPSKRLPIKAKRASLVARKSSGTSSKPPPSRKAKALIEDEQEQPIAGPSRLPDAPKKTSRKAAASRKGKKAVDVDEETPAPAPKRKGRPAKSKQPIEEPKTATTTKRKTKVVALEDAEDKPAPKKRAAASKSKAPRDGDEDVPPKKTTAKASTSSAGTTSKAKAKPKARGAAQVAEETTEVDADPPARVRRARAVKARATYAELSEDEDDGEEEPPKARRKPVAPDAVPISAKRKGKQREVAEEEDTVKPVKVKAKGAKSRVPKKRALEDANEDDGEAARPAKRPKAPPKEAEPSRTRLEAIPEEDEEEEVVEAVETPVQSKQGTGKTALDVAPSKKRPRERNEDVVEAAAAQKARKRAKVAKDVPTPVLEDASAPLPIAPAKPKNRAPAKRSTKSATEKRAAPIPSKKLKENTPTSPVAAAVAKPASVIKRSGPPKSVLDRVRAHAGSRIVVLDDDEPDELDFLS